MKNWTVDTNVLAKYPEQYKIWQLEQMINYGLDGQKISSQFLKENISRISIDPYKKKYLKFLLLTK